jgi:microcystin-dependent protein
LGILWPHSNSIVWTNAGVRAAGAKAYFFEADTTTPRSTFHDADLTTPHTHPVVADGNGRFPAIFIDFGSYRERIRTAGDTTLWDTDGVPNPAPFNEDVGVDANALLQTGQFVFELIDGTRPGFVRANGRTIGSGVSGASERANADTEDLYTRLYNALSNTVCPVSTGRGSNAAADFAANKTLGLPDLRGSVPAGLDTMGNGAASRFDASVPFPVGSASVAGSVAGANHVTLDTTTIPSHTHTFAATSGAGGSHAHTFSATTSAGSAHTHTITITDPGHAHGGVVQQPPVLNRSYSTPGNNGATWDGALTISNTNPNTTGIAASSSSESAHTHTVSGTTGAESSHTHSVTGTSGSTGGAAAHSNTQRSVLGTWFIKL